MAGTIRRHDEEDDVPGADGVGGGDAGSGRRGQRATQAGARRGGAGDVDVEQR